MQQQIREMPKEQFPLVSRYIEYYKSNKLRPVTEPAIMIWWLATGGAINRHGQVININDPGTRAMAFKDLGIKNFKDV